MEFRRLRRLWRSPALRYPNKLVILVGYIVLTIGGVGVAYFGRFASADRYPGGLGPTGSFLSLSFCITVMMLLVYIFYERKRQDDLKEDRRWSLAQHIRMIAEGGRDDRSCPAGRLRYPVDSVTQS
jgi:hypothetical protein